MRLTFLGTGTSFGIPVIGCNCQACTSSDPRDQRTRHGALLQNDDASSTVLIDTPPELRLQLLAARVSHLDAVWFTHEHADHTHGIDDLRIFSYDETRMLPAYADEDCAAFMRAKFDYIFNEAYRPVGGPKVNLQLHTFRELEPVQVAGFEMIPLAFPHGDVSTFGFRVGDLGYVTDAKAVPEHARRALEGIRVLVLNALWFGKSHPTHMSIEEAMQVAQQLGAERTYLTHLTHRVVHAETEARLPANVRLAYDGLTVEI